MKRWILCVCLSVVGAAPAALLTGCGAGDDEPRPAPPPVKDTVFGDTVAAKDRVKQQIEQAEKVHKEQLEQAMKQSE